MDCSICTEAITETTSSARMTCGHTFHFGCLATWATTAQTCPMCRHEFGETETVEKPHEEVADYRNLWINTAVGMGRTGTIQSMLNALDASPIEGRSDTNSSFGRRQMWRPRIRRELEARYARRDPEDYPDGTDPIDIELVMEQANVSRETAERYLAYHKGDVVETVMCFLSSDDDRPIPDFRPDPSRPALSEPYVSRNIVSRTGITALTTQLYDDGYESV